VTHVELSVIVPVGAVNDRASRCLRQLRACIDASERRAELVLVLNGPDPVQRHGLADVLADRAIVTIERQCRIGSAPARCLGVDAARGPLLLFTDADCVVPPTWIAAMAAGAECHGVCTSHVTAANRVRNVYIRLEEKIDRYRNSQTAPSGGRRFCTFQSFATRREALIRPVPDATNTAEDLQISLEYLARGITIGEVRGAEPATFYPASLRECLQRRTKHARGVAFMQRLWPRERWAELGFTPLADLRSMPRRARQMGLTGLELAFYFVLQTYFVLNWQFYVSARRAPGSADGGRRGAAPTGGR
jgi:cellulose synthase/poly-beta-1,6-N-acetylglucosamine synthase-like glycosyltransferase